MDELTREERLRIAKEHLDAKKQLAKNASFVDTGS